MIDNEQLKLVLASNSPTRKAMLSAAGIKFTTQSAQLDENIIKRNNDKLGIAPAQTAQDLATAKAMAVAKNVSPQNQSALILGADQICHMDGELFSKPGTKTKLFDQIKQLNGKTHTLSSAICIILNGEIIFQTIDEAHLTMYKMSDAEISNYVERAAGDVLNTAAGYHIEQIGVQLFKKINGSHFTILGLPLLPLFGFLNQFNPEVTGH